MVCQCKVMIVEWKPRLRSFAPHYSVLCALYVIVLCAQGLEHCTLQTSEDLASFPCRRAAEAWQKITRMMRHMMTRVCLIKDLRRGEVPPFQGLQRALSFLWQL